MKILIIVKGGLIQHIVANDPDVEIFIHDYDNAGEWTTEDQNDFNIATSPDEYVNDEKFMKYINEGYAEQNRKIEKREEDIIECKTIVTTK